MGYKANEWHGRDTNFKQQGSRALYKSWDDITGLITYRSYGTPILARFKGKWYQNTRKYSVTTTRHMGYALKDAGYPKTTKVDDETFRTIVFGDKRSGGGRL